MPNRYPRQAEGERAVYDEVGDSGRRGHQISVASMQDLPYSDLVTEAGILRRMEMEENPKLNITPAAEEKEEETGELTPQEQKEISGGGWITVDDFH